jgi:Xaa-Pro aminopeptidase
MMFEHRTRALKDRMREQGIDIAIITDDDAVYYFTGYYDYLHMEFGRPTILLVHGRPHRTLERRHG